MGLHGFHETFRVGAAMDPESDTVRLYIWSATGQSEDDRHQVVVRGHDALEAVKVPYGEGCKTPSLVLPRALWEALTRTLDPGTDAIVGLKEHLADAVKVRDRLLTMAENAAPRRP